LKIRLCESAAEVAADSDALVVVTEWRQFRDLDLPALRRVMTTPILVDGRNLYTPESAVAAGFDYSGVGRPGRGRALHEEAASLPRVG
jgi:UDPglucose 6-dehydrogenase